MASPQTIQPATYDLYMREQYPDAVYNTLSYLRIGLGSIADRRQRGIMTIDFSSLNIPVGSTITNAILSLRIESHLAAAEGTTIRVSHLLRYDYVDAECCWSHYKGTTHWTTDGCMGAENDYTATDAATKVQPNPIVDNAWDAFDITSQIQHCLDDHASVWKGLISSDNQDTLNSQVQYIASEETVETQYRPKLYIAWTEPAFTPKVMFI